jgi:DNA-3-methyladenine glycosylase II
MAAHASPMTATAPPATTSGTLRPLGPFDLERTREFVSHWEPAARHTPAPREPLRLTASADDDHRGLAFALTQERPDGEVHVEVAGTDDTPAALAQIARLVSLDHDARDYPEVGVRVPAIGRLMAAAPGLRPTLFGSPYETAIWGVVSSRISMRQAARVTRELAEHHGDALDVAGARVFATPRPEVLRTLDAVPGLSDEKVRRLHGIADAALDGALDVAHLRALGSGGARAALRGLRGIGEFWAAGIWLRSCGVVDEFPVAEPRARAALAHLHGRDADDPLDDLIEMLRPYRTWTALLLRVTA